MSNNQYLISMIISVIFLFFALYLSNVSESSPNTVLISVFGAFLFFATTVASSVIKGYIDFHIKQRLKPPIKIKDYVNEQKQVFINEVSEYKVTAPISKREDKLELIEIDEIVDSISIEDKYSNILLLGQPASGKSVTIRQIYNQLAEKYVNDNDVFSLVPFYINLTHSRNPPNFENLVRYWWEKSNLVKEDFQDIFESGNLILLLDGLNDMPNQGGQRSLKNRLQEIQGFLNRNYFGHYIIACRYEDFLSYKSYNIRIEYLSNKVYYIHRLSSNKIERIAKNQFSDITSKNFTNHISYSNQLIILSRNMLALGFLMRLYSKSELVISNTFEDLYDTYFEAIYKDFNRNARNNNEKTLHYTLESLKEGLSLLAQSMLKQGVKDISEFQAKWEIWLSRSFLTSRHKLVEDSIRLGILKNSDQLVKETQNKDELTENIDLVTIVEFRHPTWYEYFALPYINSLIEKRPIWTIYPINLEMDVIRNIGNTGSIWSQIIPKLIKKYFDLDIDNELTNVYRIAIVNIAIDKKNILGCILAVLIFRETILNLTKYLQRKSKKKAIFKQVIENIQEIYSEEKEEIKEIFFEGKLRNYIVLNIIQYKKIIPDEIHILAGELRGDSQAVEYREIFDEVKDINAEGYKEHLLMTTYDEGFQKATMLFDELVGEGKNSLRELYYVFVDLYLYFKLDINIDTNLPEYSTEDLKKERKRSIKSIRQEIQKIAREISETPHKG